MHQLHRSKSDEIDKIPRGENQAASEFPIWKPLNLPKPIAELPKQDFLKGPAEKIENWKRG